MAKRERAAEVPRAGHPKPPPARFDDDAHWRSLRGSDQRLSHERTPVPAEPAAIAAGLGFVALHPSMQAVLHRVDQVAQSRATVLLTGESGTGKGLVAEMIHRMSRRRRAPFVELVCAALSESLLESELFGHERGSFTGAAFRREGRFMHAEAGTLYLDEIATAPLATQIKLLRFLQTRKFERVGGNETLTVDVRLIAATNRELRDEVKAGRFREDLFYRLNVFRIHLPPLRDRRSDVPALAERFLARFAAENDRRIDGFSPAALERLQAHDWPGNVRELEHAVEHAAIMARERLVLPNDLPDSVVWGVRDPLEVTIPGSTLADIERAAILKSMIAAGGRPTAAAAMLGISRSKMYYRLREYGWEPPHRDDQPTGDGVIATAAGLLAAGQLVADDRDRSLDDRLLDGGVVGEPEHRAERDRRGAGPGAVRPQL